MNVVFDRSVHPTSAHLVTLERDSRGVFLSLLGLVFRPADPAASRLAEPLIALVTPLGDKPGVQVLVPGYAPERWIVSPVVG